MGDTLKAFLTGVVVIGLVSAVGLHATGLAKVTSSAGKAGQGLLGTAESGQASGQLPKGAGTSG